MEVEMVTVNKLHKMLTGLIESGHGRKPIVIDKESFHDPRESDGCTMLPISGVSGPRWIPSADDDGGIKENADGTEAGRQTVVLYGCNFDPNV